MNYVYANNSTVAYKQISSTTSIRILEIIDDIVYFDIQVVRALDNNTTVRHAKVHFTKKQEYAYFFFENNRHHLMDFTVVKHSDRYIKYFL